MSDHLPAWMMSSCRATAEEDARREREMNEQIEAERARCRRLGIHNPHLGLDRSATGASPASVTGYGWMAARGE
ncbi:hypothetical protein EYE35_01275 [Cereibacter sphaeroides]|nr:hypothetical protein EYE35_01275 [Cereibacter sphaeroides]